MGKKRNLGVWQRPKNLPFLERRSAKVVENEIPSA
jgi:hypothetical protein